MRQRHPAQNVGRLGELDILIADDLDAVAPGIAKVEKGPIQQGDTSCLEGFAGRLLVVDDKSKMAAVVRGLLAPLLQRDELIPQIDKGHGIALAAQLERKETA